MYKYDIAYLYLLISPLYPDNFVTRFQQSIDEGNCVHPERCFELKLHNCKVIILSRISLSRFSPCQSHFDLKKQKRSTRDKSGICIFTFLLMREYQLSYAMKYMFSHSFLILILHFHFHLRSNHSPSRCQSYFDFEKQQGNKQDEI